MPSLARPLGMSLVGLAGFAFLPKTNPDGALVPAGVPVAISGKLQPAKEAHAALWKLVGEAGSTAKCPVGQRTASKSECLAAIREAVGSQELADFRIVVDGWASGVPQGCSYSKVSKSAVFTPVFRLSSYRNLPFRNSSYQLVCSPVLSSKLNLGETGGIAAGVTCKTPLLAGSSTGTFVRSLTDCTERFSAEVSCNGQSVVFSRVDRFFGEDLWDFWDVLMRPTDSAPPPVQKPEPPLVPGSVVHSPSWALDPRVAEIPGQFTGCPDGQRNAEESECLAAVQQAAQGQLHVRGIRVVDEGADGVVPGGCSYSRVSQRAMFNRNAAGRTSGLYTLVCEIVPPTIAILGRKMDQISHNTDYLCSSEGKLVAYGGRLRYAEWTLAYGEGRFPGLIRREGTILPDNAGVEWSEPMVLLDEARARLLNCIDGRKRKTRGLCEFDGKLSVVEFGGSVYIFARYNPMASGARHVQVTKSPLDKPYQLEPFIPLQFDDYQVTQHNNIYFMAVEARNDVLVSLFPGVINGVAGIFYSESTNGLHWRKPLMIMDSTRFGQRSNDYPVDGFVANETGIFFSVDHGINLEHGEDVEGDAAENGKCTPPHTCRYEISAIALQQQLARADSN